MPDRGGQRKSAAPPPRPPIFIPKMPGFVIVKPGGAAPNPWQRKTGRVRRRMARSTSNVKVRPDELFDALAARYLEPGGAAITLDQEGRFEVWRAKTNDGHELGNVSNAVG